MPPHRPRGQRACSVEPVQRIWEQLSSTATPVVHGNVRNRRKRLGRVRAAGCSGLLVCPGRSGNRLRRSPTSWAYARNPGGSRTAGETVSAASRPRCPTPTLSIPPSPLPTRWSALGALMRRRVFEVVGRRPELIGRHWLRNGPKASQNPRAGGGPRLVGLDRSASANDSEPASDLQF